MALSKKRGQIALPPRKSSKTRIVAAVDSVVCPLFHSPAALPYSPFQMSLIASAR